MTCCGRPLGAFSPGKFWNLKLSVMYFRRSGGYLSSIFSQILMSKSVQKRVFFAGHPFSIFEISTHVWIAMGLCFVTVTHCILLKLAFNATDSFYKVLPVQVSSFFPSEYKRMITKQSFRFTHKKIFGKINLSITKLLVHKVAGAKWSDSPRISATYRLLMTTLCIDICTQGNHKIFYNKQNYDLNFPNVWK